MITLKLGKLPDRTPVRLMIIVTPGLNRALQAYAELYRETYGQAEAVTELIPHMLEAFLASDRTYAKTLKNRTKAATLGRSTTQRDAEGA
ncbi:MAG: DUF2274 domain-containing protein [Proteobacteria bacterium]|nr:DUF2274 domain-containing protein [Pseudomonadota bacterium]